MSTSPTAMDDAARHLLRAKKGHLDSIAWLVEYFTPALTSIAHRKLKAVHGFGVDSEDLVQEVWATFIPKISMFEVRDKCATPMIMGYLSTILTNLYLNLARHRKRLAALAIQRTADHHGDTNALDAQIVAETTGIVSKVARSERQLQVSHALESLSPGDQEIIELRGVHQLPVNEVASMLELNPKTVTTRYRRALERLGQLLPNSIFEGLLYSDC